MSASDAKGRPGRRKLYVHVAFAIVGLAAMAMIVRSVGPLALVDALRASASWLPLLFALELARAATEAWATRSLSARVRARVSLAELARVHVIGYAVASVMPAGRAASEAVKAAMLSRFVGVPEAAAIAATNQSSAMLGGAITGVACTIASLAITGFSGLTIALAIFATMSIAFVAVFQIAVRRRDLGGALLRRVTKMEETSSSFEAAIARIPAVPRAATIAALVSRGLFAIELAILLVATSGSAGFGRTWLALGVSLVGGAIGDMVPGQLGASDGAFAMAAPTLGITAANGVAIAMIQHVVQLGFGLAGWTLPLVWKGAKAPSDEAPEGLSVNG